MIVFDLRCGDGHQFEAWFASSKAYDEQQARQLVSCPHCGHTDISKAPMAPRISTARAEAPPLRAMLETLRTKIEADFDYVGDRFAEEARKIHYGEAEGRPIYGEATLDESRALHEEGVEVMPLPFGPKSDG